MFWIFRLIAGLLIAKTGIVLSQSSFFYTYGNNAGDTQHPSVDDACSITYNRDIQLFGVIYSSIYVCTNGLLSLNGSYTSFTPTSFPLGSGVGMIAPFWADADLRWGGYLWARETANDAELFSNISSTVSRVYRTEFTATWALVATWEDVFAFGSIGTDPTNFYQCVVAVDDSGKTYVIYLYGDINWTYGTASSVPAQVGFDSGDGSNYFAHQDSQTVDIIDIRLQSNIGERGVWIYRLDSTTVVVPDQPTTTPQISARPDTTTLSPSATASVTRKTTTEIRGSTTESLTTESITTESITTESITTDSITTESITTESITMESITTESSITPQTSNRVDPTRTPPSATVTASVTLKTTQKAITNEIQDTTTETTTMERIPTTPQTSTQVDTMRTPPSATTTSSATEKMTQKTITNEIQDTTTETTSMERIPRTPQTSTQVDTTRKPPSVTTTASATEKMTQKPTTTEIQDTTAEPITMNRIITTPQVGSTRTPPSATASVPEKTTHKTITTESQETTDSVITDRIPTTLRTSTRVEIATVHPSATASVTEQTAQKTTTGESQDTNAESITTDKIATAEGTVKTTKESSTTTRTSGNTTSTQGSGAGITEAQGSNVGGNPEKQTTTIAGAVSAVLAFLALVALLLFFKKWKKKQLEVEDYDVENSDENEFFGRPPIHHVWPVDISSLLMTKPHQLQNDALSQIKSAQTVPKNPNKQGSYGKDLIVHEDEIPSTAPFKHEWPEALFKAVVTFAVQPLPPADTVKPPATKGNGVSKAKVKPLPSLDEKATQPLDRNAKGSKKQRKVASKTLKQINNLYGK